MFVSGRIASTGPFGPRVLASCSRFHVPPSSVARPLYTASEGFTRVPALPSHTPPSGRASIALGAASGGEAFHASRRVPSHRASVVSLTLTMIEPSGKLPSTRAPEIGSPSDVGNEVHSVPEFTASLRMDPPLIVVKSPAMTSSPRGPRAIEVTVSLMLATKLKAVPSQRASRGYLLVENAPQAYTLVLCSRSSPTIGRPMLPMPSPRLVHVVPVQRATPLNNFEDFGPDTLT